MEKVSNNELVQKSLLIFVCGLTCIYTAWYIEALQNAQAAPLSPLLMKVGPTVLSQETEHANTSSQTPANCEDALAAFDDAVIRVRELKDTRLIMIARLGKGEFSTRLNWIRLGLIEKSYLGRFPDVKFVAAEGTRVKGLGVIEIYVGGRLLYTLPIEKKAKAFCIYKSKNDVS